MKSFESNAQSKIALIMLSTGIVFLIITSQMAYLQLFKAHEYALRAQKNFTRIIPISSCRGNILDCNGSLLATNRPVVVVYWIGTGNYQLSDQQVHSVNTMAQLCQKTVSQELFNAIANTERYKKRMALFYDISLEALCKIEERFPDCPNIFIQKEFERYYPYKTFASHVVGYISAMHVSTTGRMGLEKTLEPLLHGTDGQQLQFINSFGSPLLEQEVKKASAGSSIVTTLDRSLQHIAEEAFDAEKMGALIVMDPETGALRALISRPTFDPSLFLKPISQKDWLQLQHKKPFLNRSFNAGYPPASIFKLVTLAAALEMNIIHPDELFECKGLTRFGGRSYHCKRRSGHGKLSIIEALATSCNVPFYEIGKRLSINDLAYYASLFGLGEKTNVMFAEQAGLVPTNEWKITTLGEPWWAGETLLATIGQSYVSVTPIQIACMISSIFQGYRVTPRILEQEPITTKPLPLSPQTRKFIKKSMKSVVMKGTGMNVSKIDDLTIYAKTGTAQIDNATAPHKRTKEHAWFVAGIRYQQEKPLILVLIIEHAGGSRFATQVAKRFLLSLQSLKKQQNNEEKRLFS